MVVGSVVETIIAPRSLGEGGRLAFDHTYQRQRRSPSTVADADEEVANASSLKTLQRKCRYVAVKNVD